MDSIFLQPDAGARATFLHELMHAFRCSYICLWSFPSPSTNYLIFLDGFYNELESGDQPSSSTGSLASRLFEEYQKLLFLIADDDRVPGFAFKNRLPFMELNELGLQRRASAEVQLQFYQGARIKKAIFMGCNAGEIELGMSMDTQANLEMEMKNWFPDDFSGKRPIGELQILADQNRASSSSSSLRSLSMESQEFSPFLLNIPSSSLVAEQPEEAPLQQALRPVSSSSMSPLHQAMQAFSRIRNAQFPTPETEDAAMTKAILAVLSSSSSSSSSWQQQNVNPPTQKSGAFQRYRSGLLPISARIQRQNMLQRAITFLRTLNWTRRPERFPGSRPTTTQLHHTIAERKRREKLNESFQVLRSLLPSGTKKDKASVLASTTQYLTSLKAQVADLTQRNRVLESQILARREESGEARRPPSTERLDVRVTRVAESTSEARTVELQVIVRGDCNMLDLVIRMLEFFKQIRNVSLMSSEADTQLEESSSIHRVVFRLSIEGGDWDESAFQEAVRRVVADMAQ